MRFFLSRDLRVEVYFQDFLPHQTLFIHWKQHGDPLQFSLFFSMVDSFSVYLAFLHAKTTSLFEQDIDDRKDLTSLKCLVHGDLNPANIVVSFENNFMILIDNITSAMSLKSGGYPLQDIIYFLSCFFHEDFDFYKDLGARMHNDTKKFLLKTFCDGYISKFVEVMGFSEAQRISVVEQMSFVKTAFNEKFCGDSKNFNVLFDQHFVFLEDRLAKES